MSVSDREPLLFTVRSGTQRAHRSSTLLTLKSQEHGVSPPMPTWSVRPTAMVWRSLPTGRIGRFLRHELLIKLGSLPDVAKFAMLVVG